MTESLVSCIANMFPHWSVIKNMPTEIQWARMRVLKNGEDKCAFGFGIENFSLLNMKNGEKIKTPEFAFEADRNVKFHLEIYPNGSDAKSKGYVGVFLNCHSKVSVNTVFYLAMFNCHKKILEKWKSPLAEFSLEHPSWGNSQFMSREYLLGSNVIPNDQLKIACFVFSVNSQIAKTEIIAGYDRIPESITPVKEFNLLKTLYGQENLKDFRIIIDNKEILVHKNIIAAYSPVFAAMIEGDMKEAKNNFVEIKDSKFEVIKDMVDFFYTEKIKDSAINNALELLVVADKYDISILKTQCQSYLISHLHLNNVCQILACADLHMIEDLKEAAKDFIIFNKNQVIETAEYENLMEKNPKLIFETFGLTKSMDKKKKNKQDNSDIPAKKSK